MKQNVLFAIITLAIATSCSHKITGNSSSTNSVKEEETAGRINLVAGQKYVVENKLTTSSNIEMQGQAMESTADINSTYKIMVNDVTDGKYNMTNTMSSIRINMGAMGQNMSFDSDKKEDMEGEMGNGIKNYINQANPVVMDKSGNIIVSEQKDSAISDSDNTPKRMEAEMIMKQMGDPADQGYGAKMAFLSLPKNAKPGTSWQDSTSKDGITRVTNYAVKAINGNAATISTSGTEKRETKMEMQGMEINTNTTGTFTGEEIVDITTGVVSQNNTSADASGTIQMMGQDIPTKIKATSITTVKPL